MPFFVYILEVSDGSFYTGYTKDINHRMKKHNDGTGSKYVRGKLPFVLKYKEVFKTKSEAMKREIAIKKLTRKKKLLLIKLQ